VNTRWSEYYKKNERQTDLDLTRTLYESVAAVAEEYPDRIAIEHGTALFSYRMLIDEIDRTAYSLEKLGVGRGDKVAVATNGIPATVFAIYALNKLGATACMMDHRITRNRFVSEANKCGFKLAFMTAELFGRLSPVIADTSVVTVIISRVRDYFPLRDRFNLDVRKIVSFDKVRYDHSLMPDDFRLVMWDKMIKENREFTNREAAERPADETSFLFFSGYAEDEQTAVCVSDQAINSAVSLEMFMIANPDGTAGGRRVLSYVEKAFVYGFAIGIHMALAGGNTLLLCAADPSEFPTAEVNFYKPDVFVAYPSIVCGFVDNVRIHDTALTELKVIISGGDLFGGARLNNVVYFLRERGSEAVIYQTYGTAETMSVAIFRPIITDSDRLLGIPVPGVAVKICERDTMGEMPVGKKGEICVLTPARISSYYENVDLDHKMLRHQPDGRVWVLTGDIGHIDERGMIYFDGNSKRSIERHGTLIYPQVIESEIKNVYGVTDVCVVPVAKKDGTCDLIAVVEPISDYLFNNERLRNLKSSIELECSLVLSPPMIPDDVEFRAYIPKGAYGRPNYAEIAESVAQNRLNTEESRD